jgi:hypothetical protein
LTIHATPKAMRHTVSTPRSILVGSSTSLANSQCSAFTPSHDIAMTMTAAQIE